MPYAKTSNTTNAIPLSAAPATTTQVRAPMGFTTLSLETLLPASIPTLVPPQLEPALLQGHEHNMSYPMVITPALVNVPSVLAQDIQDATLVPTLPSHTLRPLAALARRDTCHLRVLFPKGQGPNSKALDTRFWTGTWHDHHGPPQRPAQEGFVFDILFGCILGALESMKITERMTGGKDGGAPVVYRNAIAFHRSNWTKFASLCGRPWLDLSLNEREAALRQFFINKFSADPKKKQMQPAPGDRPKMISGMGRDFRMTDAELDALVNMVIQAYNAQS